MSGNTEYQGWANWTTWNVSLWLNSEEPIYRAMVREAAVHKYHVSARQAQRFAAGMFGSTTPDGAQLRFCRWGEIASMMNECR
jgi:hypothetical protein